MSFTFRIRACTQTESIIGVRARMTISFDVKNVSTEVRMKKYSMRRDVDPLHRSATWNATKWKKPDSPSPSEMRAKERINATIPPLESSADVTDPKGSILNARPMATRAIGSQASLEGKDRASNQRSNGSRPDETIATIVVKAPRRMNAAPVPWVDRWAATGATSASAGRARSPGTNFLVVPTESMMGQH